MEEEEFTIEYCPHCSQPMNITDFFDEEEEDNLTVGERLADIVADHAGSWTFIVCFIVLLVVWIVYNFYTVDPVDPYPFILLNLILSTIAALQAPLIMMSQNRQEHKDRIRAENDYRVNLITEKFSKDTNKKLEILLNELVRNKK